jgi:hypothetical protein
MNTNTTSNSLFDVLNKNTSDISSKVYTNIADNTSSAINNIRNFYDKSLNNNTLFIGLFIVILIAIIIAYILYTYIGNLLFSKVRNVVHDTRIPIVGTKLNKFEAIIDTTGNGGRRTYTFWIYINDMNTYRGQYKHVAALSHTGEKFDPVNCSPHIFLDKEDNKLYIRFSDKNKDKKFNSNDDTIKSYLETGIIIPYIPLQRWVHISVVCNTNSFNSYIYTYVDGDLVKSLNNGEKEEFKGQQITTNYNNIDLNTSGFLYTGNTEGYEGISGTGFSGLISKFTSFNYELNQVDIYNDYNTGPIDSIFAKIGLGLYGVRNPIYKI